MFKHIRQLLGAQQDVHQRIAALLEKIDQKLEARSDERSAERLDELERTRALWEAEVEGQLAKAGSAFRNARSAEERTRSMVDNVPSEGDASSDDAIEAHIRSLRDLDANGGEEEGLQPVRKSVGSHRASKRQNATRLKFGV